MGSARLADGESAVGEQFLFMQKSRACFDALWECEGLQAALMIQRHDAKQPFCVEFEAIMLVEAARLPAGGIDDPVAMQNDDMRAANPAVLRWIGEDVG